MGLKHILVTGSHRSGTTWVGRTLAQHPRIKYIHEPFNITHPNQQMGLRLQTGFDYAPASPQKDDIQTAFDRLLWSTPFERAFQACKKIGLDAKTPLRFCKHVFGGYYHRFLIKDPLALLSAGWLYERYDLTVICMIRNPYAFVGSLKKAGWDFDFQHLKKQKELMQAQLAPYRDAVNAMCEGVGDFLDRACLLWNILHFVILDYSEKYPSWMFVKHEDIAAAPPSEFEKLFSHAGLRMSRSITAYIDEFTSSSNPAEAKSSKYAPRNSREALETWRKRLSDEETDRVKTATKDVADRLYGGNLLAP